MKLRLNKLSNQLGLLLISSTLLLLTILLGYLYISNRKYIQNSAIQRVWDISHSQTQNIEKNINLCENEIKAFFKQIDYSKINSLLINEEVQNTFYYSRAFFLQPHNNFESIQIWHNHWDNTLLIEPVKIFGGEVKIKYSRLPKHELTDIPKQTQITPFNPQQGGQSVTLIIPVTSEVLVKTLIDLETLIKDPTNPSDKTLLFSEAGYIHYSNTEEEAGLKISNRTDFPQVLIKDKAENIILYNHSAWKLFYIQSLNLFLLNSASYDQELTQFHQLFIRMILFSLFILVGVFWLVYQITKGMSNTLQKVTSVTQKVAKGNFSEKINLVRNDEFGELINAFNTMVSELATNYSLLQDANQEVELKVDELIKTRAELSQKQRMALIGETTSRISHEIQNKIGGISIWIQNLEQTLHKDEHSQYCLSEMKNALQQFMNMLANFKRFYRDPQINKSQTNVSKIINSSLKQIETEINAKDIQIKLIDLHDQITLLADTMLLEEAVINILINAVYYTPDNGTISISLLKKDEKILIQISDSGTGIQEKDLPYLFQPFYTTKSSGSGLGLATAINIIRAHNGEIKVFNQDHSGACFTIELPLYKS